MNGRSPSIPTFTVICQVHADRCRKLPTIDRITLRDYNNLTSKEEGETLADELLTIEQVAAELQLHPDTIRRYIRQRKLKSTKIGGKITIGQFADPLLHIFVVRIKRTLICAVGFTDRPEELTKPR